MERLYYSILVHFVVLSPGKVPENCFMKNGRLDTSCLVNITHLDNRLMCLISFFPSTLPYKNLAILVINSSLVFGFMIFYKEMFKHLVGI